MVAGLFAAAEQDRLRTPFGTAAEGDGWGGRLPSGGWVQFDDQGRLQSVRSPPQEGASGELGEDIVVFGYPDSGTAGDGTGTGDTGGGMDPGSGDGGIDPGSGDGGTDPGSGDGGLDGGTDTDPGGIELGDYTGDSPDTGLVQPVNCSDGMSDTCTSRDPWVGIIFAADQNDGVTDPAYEATIDGQPMNIVWGGGAMDPTPPDFSTYQVLGGPNPAFGQGHGVTDPLPLLP
jgi:hypothetical protein